MQIKSDVTMFYSRFQTILRRRQRKQQEKPALEISAPFNFKREPACLPNITEDEISILREKAAASRIGIAEAMPLSPSLTTASRPRPTPPSVNIIPPSSPRMATRPSASI